MKFALKNIVIFTIIIIFIYLYINIICSCPSLSSSYVERNLLNTHNISENDWCSIEIKSYLILFFLCLERIPNIGIYI